MTETSECAPLISVDKFKANDEQGASADIETFVDEASDNQNTIPIQQAAAPFPVVNSQGLGANIQHASAVPLQCSNCQQYTVIMTEPTTSAAHQMQVSNRTDSDDSSRDLCILLVCSSLSCLVCWPLAITALTLTGYAYIEAKHGQNPRPLMVGAGVAILLSLIVGIPLTVLFLIFYIRPIFAY
ncbi:uncharacterized protein [Dysidea avara]